MSSSLRRLQLIAVLSASTMPASQVYAARGGEILLAPFRVVFEIVFDVLIYEPLQIWFLVFALLALGFRVVLYAKKVRLTWKPPSVDERVSTGMRQCFWIMYVSTVLACATLAIGFVLNIIL